MNWLAPLTSSSPVLWAAQLVRELVRTRRLARVGVAVAGQVVRQRRVSGSRRSYLAPVLRFTARVGPVLAAERTGHASGLPFHDGDMVRLRYDPDQPTCSLLVPEMGKASCQTRLGVVAALLVLLWRW